MYFLNLSLLYMLTAYILVASSFRKIRIIDGSNAIITKKTQPLPQWSISFKEELLPIFFPKERILILLTLILIFHGPYFSHK